MKTFNKLIVFALALLMFSACDQNYIDDISRVDPGADKSAPVVTIKSPADGYQIKVPEAVAPVTISFEATDDIELASISVQINGSEIAKYADFKDYRRAIKELEFDQVTNGTHELKIVATDIDGKSTAAIVHFEKVSPYNKKYDGEIFYMPFDGDYMELISFNTAEKTGNPGFAGEGVLGDNAYKGTSGSYLSFPAENLAGDAFSATFWYKVNPVPAKAGILSAGATADSRKQGFRLFREGNETEQRIKLNVGTGDGESWNDGALIDATTGQWIHIAISISATENTVYFDGVPVRTSTMSNAMSWDGVESVAIGSGGETFSYWDHLSDLSYIDELRFYSKALSAAEIQTILYNDMPYEPKYDGEIFYMPFEGNNKDWVSTVDATVVGSPGFAEGKKGQAYSGAADSYLTFPAEGLKHEAFSAVFWMNVNTLAPKAGILVMGPEDTENANYPEKQNKRTSGFRFFREKSGEKQIVKLNAGNGTADSWFDGGNDAKIDPEAVEWTHFAFTISTGECVVYIDGEIAKKGDFAGVDWTGCDLLSIMSGAPRFTGWDHFSDQSLMDELRLFNKALSQTEIQGIYEAEK